MSNQLTVATLDDLIRKMPPRTPISVRINQHALDVLRQHIDLSDTGTPFSGIHFRVTDVLPNGVIAMGWDMLGGGFELDALYNITDFTQPHT